MKKKNIFRIIILCLFVLCTVIIGLNINLLFKKSFHIQYSDIVCACLDKGGNQIIVDDGGQRLSKVNSENKAVFSLKNGINPGMENIVKAITDRYNNIYLLNRVKEEGGYRIQREEIVEYSPEGKYLGIVKQIIHKKAVLVKSIEGLYLYNGSLSYIITKADSFGLYDKSGQLIRNCECNGIQNLIVSYAINPDTHDIFYSTRQGKILRYVDGKADKQLYDANQYTYLSVPRDICIDQNKNLYFTDIGLRTVSKIDQDGKLSHVIYDGKVGKNTDTKAIYNFVDSANGLISETSSFVVTDRDGTASTSSGAAYSLKNCMLIIADWICVILLGILALYLFCRLIAALILKGSKSLKISIGVICGALAIAGIFILMVIPDFESRLMHAVLQRAQTISDTIQIVVPTEQYKKLDRTGDYLGEDYNAVRNSVKEIFSEKNGDNNDFYCVLYTVHKKIITGTFSLQEYSGAVYPYDWPYVGSDEQSIISSGKGKVYTDNTTSEGKFLFVYNPLFDKNGNVVGLIEVGTDLNSFHKATNNMIMQLLINVLAITVVIILISMELIIFNHGRSEYLKNLSNRKENTLVRLPNEVLRILVFAIFFITNMTTSFLSVHAMNIAGNSVSFGIPKEVLAAIPISAEVLFGALASIFGSRILECIGQKKTALLGSCLFTGGLVIRFILSDIWVLTLGNSIMGCGWGFLLLIVNTAIAGSQDEEKNKGFAGYTAAALNGINCGIVFGGFLINWLSHTAIFMVAAGLSILVAIHAGLYLTKANITEEESTEAQTAAPISLFRFLTDKSILMFFTMIVIPIVACSYFLNYLYPILGLNYGMEETKIGYSYLINGLCVMLLSTVLTKYFSTRVKKAYSLVIASLLYVAAFLCVAIFQNVISLMAVLVLLGISDSFGLPLQTSYYTDLEAVKRYGFSKSIGIYSLFENAAQAAGSFIFSYVLIIGVRKGLVMVLGIVAIFAVIFGMVNLFRNRKIQGKA